MKSALILFNGIQFSFNLVDHAIDWAKAGSGRLHFLFLKATEETSPGYGFPSDIQQAETVTDAEDAEKSDERIIRQQMELVENMAAMEKIPCQVELRTEPSLEEVIEVAKTADILFLEAGEEETTGTLASTRFTMEKLREQAPCPVELVP